MDRRQSSSSKRRPPFEDFNGIEVASLPGKSQLFLKGGIGAVCCYGVWVLADLASKVLDSPTLSESGKILLCLAVAACVLALCGFAIWCIRMVVDNAKIKETRKRSPQPRDRPGRSRSP